MCLTLKHIPASIPRFLLYSIQLNKNLQPLPVGVPGELHLGGVGLARGYLNRPNLTEKSFILNLFSYSTEDRLYKTEDRDVQVLDKQIRKSDDQL